MDIRSEISQGQAITLEAMLARRDALEALLNERQGPVYQVVCQCNVPGAVKNWPRLTAFFQAQCAELVQSLKEEELKPRLIRSEPELITGPLCIFEILRYEILAWELKAALVAFEDAYPWRRLLDCDLRYNGAYLSREQLGHAPRPCLLCDAPAILCRRSQEHSQGAFDLRVSELLALAEERGGL